MSENGVEHDMPFEELVQEFRFFLAHGKAKENGAKVVGVQIALKILFTNISLSSDASCFG